MKVMKVRCQIEAADTVGIVGGLQMIFGTHYSILHWKFWADVKEVILRNETKSPTFRHSLSEHSLQESAKKMDSTELQSYISCFAADPLQFGQHLVSIYNGAIALALASRWGFDDLLWLE